MQGISENSIMGYPTTSVLSLNNLNDDDIGPDNGTKIHAGLSRTTSFLTVSSLRFMA